MTNTNKSAMLRDGLLTRLDELRDACQTDDSDELDEHCYRTIRHGLACTQILPPRPKTFRRWFRTACRRADGRDYSHSQRALFVRRFNTVGRDWHRAGLTPEVLQVHNYRRRLMRSVADPSVAQVLPRGQFRLLRQTFLDRLGRGDVSHGPWGAFCRLAFALVAFGGVAWSSALSAIADLIWRDLRAAAWGYITVQRRSCAFRFYLPDVACALALALGIHMRRPRVFGEADGETPILPPTDDAQCPDAEMDTEELTRQRRRRRLRIARRQFNCWLCDLCQEAGVPVVTVRTLAAASRLMLVSIYGQAIAGALLGRIPYAPVADDQRNDLFESYQRPFHLAAEPDNPQPIIPNRPPKRAATTTPVEGTALLVKRLITDVHSACRPLCANGSVSYVKVAEALEALAERLLGEMHISVAGDLSPAFRAAHARLMGDSEPEAGEAECFNVACLSAWLAHLCRTTHKAPATLRAYRSEGVRLVLQFPGICWFELDDEDALEVASLDMATSTRRRRLTVLNDLLSFLEEQVGVPIPEMQRRNVHIGRQLEPMRLLRQDGLERLVAYLLESAVRARNEGNAAAMHLAYNAYYSTLLAIFFGFRACELNRLRIGDMVLDAVWPYLRVWRSKRGRSRVVLVYHVSEDILAILHHKWARRLASADGDPAAPFLVDEHGDPVDARAPANTVIQAMEALGLRDSDGEERPVVFHTLRHVFANRLLVLGVSLRDVARAMGHLDTDTTTGSYLHCFDYLQRRRLTEEPAEFQHPGAPAAGIGALLGIGRPAAIAALKKANLYRMGTTDGNRCRLYGWGIVAQLIADRLGIIDDQASNEDLSNPRDGIESVA